MRKWLRNLLLLLTLTGILLFGWWIRPLPPTTTISDTSDGRIKVTKASRVHKGLSMSQWKIGHEVRVGCGPKGGGHIDGRKFGFFEMQDVEMYWYLSHEEFKTFDLENE